MSFWIQFGFYFSRKLHTISFLAYVLKSLKCIGHVYLKFYIVLEKFICIVSGDIKMVRWSSYSTSTTNTLIRWGLTSFELILSGEHLNLWTVEIEPNSMAKLYALAELSKRCVPFLGSMSELKCSFYKLIEHGQL